MLLMKALLLLLLLLFDICDALNALVVVRNAHESHFIASTCSWLADCPFLCVRASFTIHKAIVRVLGSEKSRRFVERISWKFPIRQRQQLICSPSIHRKLAWNWICDRLQRPEQRYPSVNSVVGQN